MARENVWTRRRPATRQPRFTLDDLAQAAIRIADSEGIEALSMRRLAVELDAGTMTVYHYVRTKDELLALVTDAVMGELHVPDDEFPPKWRDAITAIARRSHDVFFRHPWVFEIVEDPAVGPNGVRHFDQSMQAVSSLPGTLTDRLDVIFAVDEYVLGHCLLTRNYVGEGRMDDVAEPMRKRISDHRRDEARFERNLARLLDGIDGSLRSRR